MDKAIEFYIREQLVNRVPGSRRIDAPAATSRKPDIGVKDRLYIFLDVLTRDDRSGLFDLNRFFFRPSRTFSLAAFG